MPAQEKYYCKSEIQSDGKIFKKGELYTGKLRSHLKDALIAESELKKKAVDLKK